MRWLHCAADCHSVCNDVGSVKTHFSAHLPGSVFSLTRNLFLRPRFVLESFDGTAEVPPAIYSIPTHVRTMILSSNSPTLWEARMPNQTGGLNHDHGMTRAVLHANPGSAAHSSLASAASSTTSPPASVPWPLSPAHDTSAGPNVDTPDASPAHTGRTLRRFHQQPAQKRIALFADVPQPLLVPAAGILAGNQPQVAGDLFTPLETLGRPHSQIVIHCIDSNNTMSLVFRICPTMRDLPSGDQAAPLQTVPHQAPDIRGYRCWQCVPVGLRGSTAASSLRASSSAIRSCLFPSDRSNTRPA